jgi:NADPH:quinone reductase
LNDRLDNYIYTAEELYRYSEEYLGLLKDGLEVRVYKEYPFSAEGVAQSQIDITGRGTIGKLLIKIADPSSSGDASNFVSKSNL